MRQAVTFLLEGRHYRESHWETNTTTGQGIYSERGELSILHYQEEAEGSRIRTKISWKGTVLEVERSGDVQSSLVYEMGQEHVCPYQTPFGVMDIHTFTQAIEETRTDEGLTLLVTYRIAYGDEEEPQKAVLRLEIRLHPQEA